MPARFYSFRLFGLKTYMKMRKYFGGTSQGGMGDVRAEHAWHIATQSVHERYFWLLTGIFNHYIQTQGLFFETISQFM
jgi:hypothetical protein